MIGELNKAIPAKNIPMHLEQQYYFIIVGFGSSKEKRGILKPKLMKGRKHGNN